MKGSTEICSHAVSGLKVLLGAAALGAFAVGCGGAQSSKLGTTGDNPFDSMTSTQEGISASPPPCGTVIASFNGTAAHSNGVDTGTGWSCGGTGTYGLNYQCVELVNRYYLTHGLGARIYGNAGYDMCNNAPSADYIVYRPGSNVRPVPGDALEWEDSANNGGHTALVTGSSSGWITFIQQNVGTRYTYYPTDGVSWNGSSFGWYSGLRPVCWIHPRRSGGTPAPTAECSSATLDKNVPSGTCVQAASDDQWYHCSNGAWYGGETNCTSVYPWCHSATMNAMEPPRTCVHSKFDGIEYQCGANGGWYSGVSNGAGPLGPCAKMLP